MADGPSAEETEAVSRLIGRALLVAIQGEDRAALEAFLAAELPRCMGPADEAPDPRALRALVVQATLMIWNATPLPSAGYRPRPVKAPERNDPCACGSGAKFKKCCGGFGQAFPTIPPEEVWASLAAEIEAGPAERLLGTNGLPPGALAPLAERLSELGLASRAARLLRKALNAAPELDDRHQDALVLEAELDLGANGPGAALERVQKRVEGLSRTLRGGVLEGLVPALADRGDLDGAWALLHQIRRETPESPGLSHLEVMLHLVGDALPLAAERARFWLAWWRRRGVTEDAEEVVRFLDLAARDPAGARAELTEGEGRVAPPFLARLEDLVAAWGPRPVLRHEVEEIDPGRVGLVAPPGVAEIETGWTKVWPVKKPLLVSFEIDPPSETFSEYDRWIAFLRSHPGASDSLSILDDLALLVAPIAAEMEPRLDGALLVPLLDRAVGIIRASLESRGSRRVPWGFEANRPALRLLAVGAVRLHERGKSDEAATMFEWMLELNPEDNHGNRCWLVNHYLRVGNDERALAVARHHDDDGLADTRYGKVLALWRLARRAEATDAARAAVNESPRIARALLAARMEEPEAGRYGVEFGGEEEAWLYREEMRETWSATPGAMELLAAVAAPASRKKARKAAAPRRAR